MKFFRNNKSSVSALAVAALVTVSSAFLEAAPAYAKAPAKRSRQFSTASAIAVADKFSADAAEQIFKEGGNAVDAAVAIAFTLAVTYPEAGNIGGGGFMTLYVDGKPYFLDYREKAPLAATKNMYLDDKGEVIKGMSLVRLSRGRRAGHGRRHVGSAAPLRQAEVEAGAGARHQVRHATASKSASSCSSAVTTRRKTSRARPTSIPTSATSSRASTSSSRISLRCCTRIANQGRQRLLRRQDGRPDRRFDARPRPDHEAATCSNTRPCGVSRWRRTGTAIA